jgi:hypothetical protein
MVFLFAMTEILLRFLVEGSLAAGRAETIGLALIF